VIRPRIVCRLCLVEGTWSGGVGRFFALVVVDLPCSRSRRRDTIRATVMYGAGDVRVENVPDARLIDPGDALVRVTRACICGSDLWPYNQM